MKTPFNNEQYGGQRCYRIIRFYRNGRKARTIKNGLTETEAQNHCSREDTRKEGVYFDGYDLVKGVKPYLTPAEKLHGATLAEEKGA